MPIHGWFIHVLVLLVHDCVTARVQVLAEEAKVRDQIEVKEKECAELRGTLDTVSMTIRGLLL